MSIRKMKIVALKNDFYSITTQRENILIMWQKTTKAYNKAKHVHPNTEEKLERQKMIQNIAFDNITNIIKEEIDEP